MWLTVHSLDDEMTKKNSFHACLFCHVFDPTRLTLSAWFHAKAFRSKRIKDRVLPYQCVDLRLCGQLLICCCQTDIYIHVKLLRNISIYKCYCREIFWLWTQPCVLPKTQSWEENLHGGAQALHATCVLYSKGPKEIFFFLWWHSQSVWCSSSNCSPAGSWHVWFSYWRLTRSSHAILHGLPFPTILQKHTVTS